MKKLGLSTYENDNKPTDKKFAYIIDESIMVNREKLLLILGVSAEHPGHPLKHEDVTVVSMKSCGCFKGDDIKQEIEKSIEKNGAKPEYVISDQAHNLTNGISQSGLLFRELYYYSWKGQIAISSYRQGLSFTTQYA